MKNLNKIEKLKKILYYVEKEGISAYKIAQATKISEAGIGKILNKSSKNPQERTVDAIYEYLFSTENNYNNEDVTNTVSEAMEVDFTQLSVMYVPLVNKFAYAGYLNGYGDDEYIEELPKVPFANDRENKGNYLCFEVKGDSMDDGSYQSYLEGDILLCRNVRQDFWKSKLHINKWDFVIVHKELGILVKRIVNHNVEKGIITLHSLNDYYEDFEVQLKDVARIFNIVDFRRKSSRR